MNRPTSRGGRRRGVAGANGVAVGAVVGRCERLVVTYGPLVERNVGRTIGRGGDAMSNVHGEDRLVRREEELGDRSQSRPAQREHRAAATTAGVLYIVGTVAGIFSKVVAYFPVRDADDPLAYAMAHSDAVATGALFVLVMGLSLAFVPVVLFPVLRQVNDLLATGYLIIRGAVETVIYVILAIVLLLLVPLGETMTAGSGTNTPAGVRLGLLVIDADDASAVLTLVFCLGAVLFYVLLFRSRIVPRWISMWGLVGVPFYAAAYLLAMYGAVGTNSSAQNLLQVPLFVQEMVLAVWMIARGFRPAVTSTVGVSGTRESVGMTVG